MAFLPSRCSRVLRRDDAPDVVEQRLEHQVVGRLDPVAPDRLVGAGGLAVDGVPEQRAPLDALDPNQCSARMSGGLTTRKARTAPGRANSCQRISWVRSSSPSGRGAGAICVSQIVPQFAISAASRSGVASNVLS